MTRQVILTDKEWVTRGNVGYYEYTNTIQATFHTFSQESEEYEVPEPLREEPEEGVTVYTGIPSPYIEGRPYDKSFYYLFTKGFLHSTKEAAILHRKALSSFTTLKKEGIN
jgi:hypothetical protein